MSLHTLANHLQSAGRGEDKVLVHMTPGEVKGLQSLAMAHGGSLSINPETGLPEAGILSSLLPMIAGFALGPAGFKLMSAAQAGLAVGALTGVATGSLKQGIMAGLGAYGGAGLGEGLMAQGATPASTGSGIGLQAPTDATRIGLQNNGATVGLKAPVFEPSVVNSNMGLKAYQPSMPSGLTNVSSGMTPTNLTQARLPQYANFDFTTGMKPPTAVGPISTYAPNGFDAGKNLSGVMEPPYVTRTGNPYRVIEIKGDPILEAYGPLNPAPVSYTPPKPIADFSNFPKPLQTSGASTAIGRPSGRIDVLPSDPALAQPQSISGPFRDQMSQLGRGFSASTKDFEGLKGLYNAMPQGSVIASGLTLAEAMKPEKLKEKKDKSLIRPYEFDYGSTNVSGDPYSGSAERTYFNPVFTAKTSYEAPGREYAASGGLMGYAVGGPVEQMAAMNAVGANTGYPQANLQTPMYSNPAMQRPQAANVIAPSADAGVNTYTGEARFGDGGPIDTRPFFNPNTSGMSAENYTRSELAGGRRAPIATPTVAPANQYTYDPKTMQFTQTGGKGEVSGGVAQLAGQPIMQPTSPAQPLIPAINIPAYQTPEQQLGLGGFYNMMNQQLGGYGGYAGYAAGGNVGGMPNLGDYSDGGRLLKGPGDGVSDSIPASIGNRQPARLADGEFVVPARIVSELGNGSTEAGARKLYAMMDRVQKARRKTVGKGKVAVNSKAENTLPA
jgi:hypothetical protein